MARQLRKSPPRAQDSHAGLRGQAQGEGGGRPATLGLPWQPLARPEAQSGVFLDCSGVTLTSKWQCQPHGTRPAWRVGQGRASHGQESTPLALEGLSSRPETNTPPRPGHILMGVTRQGAGRAGVGAGARTPGGPTAAAPALSAKGPPGADRVPRQPAALTHPPDVTPAAPRPRFWFHPKENPPGAARATCEIRPCRLRPTHGAGQ